MSTATDALAEAARRVARTVDPAVVRIGRHGGRGCGLVVGPGLVLTNAHNLRDRTTEVGFADGRRAQGAVLGADLDGDLAVLEVDTGGVAPLEWSAQEVQPGDLVFAVTRTHSGSSRVTFGMVSGVDRAFRGPRGRRIAGSVEHTAPLARGSSGSPLVDSDGRIVGVNTHRVGDGFYLAVAATAELRTRVEALARGESPKQVRLGVGLAPAHVARRLRRAVGLPERDGLLVRTVEPDMPAARAALQPGDLLVSVDGVDVDTIDALFDALERAAGNASIRVRVVRGVDEIEIAVRLDEDVRTDEGEA